MTLRERQTMAVAAAAPDEPTEPTETPSEPVSEPVSRPKPRSNARKKQPASAGPKAKPAPNDSVRKIPSNAHIPASLKGEVDEAKARLGLSSGGLIIAALEAANREGVLADLVQPVGQAGGGLFDSWADQSPRRSEETPTPLNYRLREKDYTVIDKLVEQTGASSRGHLYTAALTWFLKKKS